MASAYTNIEWKTWIGQTPSQRYYTYEPTWQFWNDTATTTAATTYKVHDAWGEWNGQHYVYTRPVASNSTSTADTWGLWAKYANSLYTPKIREQVTRGLAIENPHPVYPTPNMNITIHSDAKERAKKLLIDNLTPTQRVMMERHGYFTVRSQHGKIYRVYTNRGHHNNVFEVNRQGQHLRELCAAPRGDMPEEDKFLGQKLALELAEDTFLTKANVWELEDGRQFQPNPNRELCNVG